MADDEVITGRSLDSFRTILAGKKVGLLYPHSPYRQVFLSHCLQAAGSGLLYYALPQANMPLQTWLADLAQTLSAMGVGSQLRQALDSKAQAPVLGEALAADLNQSPESHYWWYSINWITHPIPLIFWTSFQP